MNQFNREELEFIDECLSYMMGDFSEELRNKIRAMIDDYCEHKWEQLEFSSPIVTPTWVCLNCRAIRYNREENHQRAHKIAAMHLKQASDLISHASELLWNEKKIGQQKIKCECTGQFICHHCYFTQ